ncbi:hypothetical protein DSCO28_40430 [Desulfosarcina ovata subsp. sediminis]|uniref:Uncharacterized protein n=1 Tax=Desulfosarcina ovata subsp. sediminis TaxID=885957 RepID=A0A5K7ZTD5_9BACT|nr:hypothetical protein [Desulfosarcina ovata]BBO83477.1 hypothetical protein DSCO28_40430 [Desulfosarcina ovata subsp. sediminis]
MAITETKKTIVVLGSFNPAIFQPAWIEHNSLLPEEEMNGFYNEKIVKKIPELGLEIGTGQQFQVNNDQAVATFKSFSLQVNRERFIAIITSDSNLTIKFIRKIFRMLAETPVTAIGFNFHTSIAYEENYNTLIDSLFDKKAPLLRTFGEDIELGFSVKSNFNGSIVTTKVNRFVKKDTDEVYIHSNFHRDLPGGVTHLNDLDLKTSYDNSEDYFLNSLIKGLGKIKKED